MVKTNEWTIADLIKYLCSVRGTLSDEELEKLKQTSTFSKEETAPGEVAVKVQTRSARYRANELYEPLPSLRELGLPIIDWGAKNKWRGNSGEGDLTSCTDELLLTLTTCQLVFCLSWDC